MNKNALFLVVLFIAALAAAGCQTAKGIGQDLENTGENIQEGVNKIK